MNFDARAVVSNRCDSGLGRYMPIANLYLGANWRLNRRDRNPVHVPGREFGAQEIFIAADDHALGSRFSSDDVQWLACGHTKPAPLADGEVMHARVFAEHVTLGVANLALRLFRSDATLAKVSVDECRVVAVGNEADLLAIRLGGDGQSQFASQFANLRLGVTSQRKIGARQLLLFQAEQKIGLILGVVRAAAHLIAVGRVVKADARVMAGRDARGPHARRQIEELIELDEVVAERAGNGRAACQIIVDKRLHHLLLEARLEINHVIGNPQMLRDMTRVIDVVKRAAAARRAAFRNKLRQATLIPELHRQPNYGLAAALQ